jgi:hypothetical protein
MREFAERIGTQIDKQLTIEVKCRDMPYVVNKALEDPAGQSQAEGGC